MSGFKVMFSGFGRLVVAVCLVMMVAGGAVAGVTENAAAVKSNAAKIERVQENLSAVKARVEDIHKWQLKNSGQMWFERTKEKAKSVEKDASDIKRWVESEKESSDKWSMGLTLFSVLFGVVAIVISVMTFLTAREQKIDAKEAKENLEKEVSKQQQYMENFVVKKEFEIIELTAKCEEMADRCQANLSITDDIVQQAESTVESLNSHEAKDMSESDKEAIKTVAENKLRTTYTHLKAKALSHEINKEWDKALNIWEILRQEFPQKTDYNYNIGHIYQKKLERVTDISEKKKYIKLAEDYYRRSTEEDDSALESWLNLASILTIKSEYYTTNEKEKFYTEAENIFEKISKKNPHDPYIWNNWAYTLFMKSNDIHTEQKKDIYKKIEKMFEKAIKYGPKMSMVWNNLGRLLLTEATTTSDEEREHLLKQSYNHLLQAEKILTGRGSYYLACLASVRGHFEECRKWLITRKKSQLNSLYYERIKKESFLENFKNAPEYKQWFEDFLEEIRREEQKAKGANPKAEES